MHWYLVVGRVRYDDEETLLVFEARDAEDARQIFVRNMLENCLMDEDDPDREVIVNWIVRCDDRPEVEFRSC